MINKMNDIPLIGIYDTCNDMMHNMYTHIYGDVARK